MVSLNVAIPLAVSLEALGNLIKYFDRQQCLPQSIFQKQMFLKSCGRNSQSLNATKHRNSCPEVFCKKGVLRNFAKFTGKHLCQSLFLIKLLALPCNFIKKETLIQVFSCEFYEISKCNFCYRTPPVAASALCLNINP